MPPTDQPWSTPGQPPPPPPPSPTAPPGGTYPAPPPPPTAGQGYPSFQGQPSHQGPPGAYPAGGNWAPAKPPRPATPIAGILMIAGAVVMVIGTVLPWVRLFGASLNGWDLEDFDSESTAAGGYVFLAVVLAGFGITTLAAKRLLPIAILAVIFGSFALLAALTDLVDVLDAEALGVEVGIGLWVVLLGAALTLTGAIWTLSIRRRWPTPAPAS